MDSIPLNLGFRKTYYEVSLNDFSILYKIPWAHCEGTPIHDECMSEKYEGQEPVCEKENANCRLENWKDIYISSGRGMLA